MLIYWLMYFIPASIALFGSGNFRKTNIILWYFIGILFILIIGPRLVGGDLVNYMSHFTDTKGLSLSQAMQVFSHGDPAYKFFNWLLNDFDWGFYAANTIYGAIFTFGLIKLSRDEINPWIAFSVAVPYLIIVVAMGYTRQSVAIGIFMLAITYLRQEKLKAYVVLILLAAMFHKTAILMLPLGFFLYGKGLILRILMLIPIMYGGWDLLLANQQEHLWHNYVEREMESQGAMIRVLMNFIPAVLLFVYRKEWKNSFNDYTFWLWIAIGSLLAVGLVSLASTAVDRISLYFIPIQLVVFSRLPYLARKQLSPKFTKMLIVFGYMAVLFVWLNFAHHSAMWLPYRNFLFEGII